jgi:hypothetical protein
MTRLMPAARRLAALSLLLAAPALTACDDSRGGLVGPGLDAPREVAARYAWRFQRWESGEPVGQPSVELSWALPSGWQGDPFRVYARRGGGSYSLIATVTSCGEGVCRYSDLNVRGGERYDYFVSTVDERSGREAESSRVQVSVPAFTRPEAPTAPVVVGLDGMAFLTWQQTGAQRFRVLLQSGSGFFDLGETDGRNFLDSRAQNGVEHRYVVAAIDTLGHFSRLSAVGIGVPRPDYHAELIHPREVNAGESGFRFVDAPDAQSPIVSGDAAAAQWRLETANGALTIRPLGNTRVTAGVFTTALSCGPGSEADCIDVRQAPAASAFGTAPVTAEAAHTYVFQVQGTDGRTRYGKIRVLGATRDALNRTVLVFDWAYQTRPDDVRLDVGVR